MRFWTIHPFYTGCAHWLVFKVRLQSDRHTQCYFADTATSTEHKSPENMIDTPTVIMSVKPSVCRLIYHSGSSQGIS